MPVSGENASLRFFVEAMKANTEALSQVSKTMRGMQDEARETLKLVHDTRERVIRIESGGQAELIIELRAKLGGLESEIDDLKRERDRRHGAVGAVEWGARFGPWLLTLAVGILAFVGWDRAG